MPSRLPTDNQLTDFAGEEGGDVDEVSVDLGQHVDDVGVADEHR